MLDLIGAISECEAIIRLGDIDPDGIIEENGVKDYIDFVGKLSYAEVSGKPIRDFTVFEETIFWFSPLAEKHGFHWGKNVFTLFYVLKNKAGLFDDVVTIILPHSLMYISSFIEDYFVSIGKPKPALIIVGTSISRYDNWHFIKNCTKNLFTSFKIRNKLKKAKGISFDGKHLFISKVNGIWNSRMNIDGDLGSVFDFIPSEADKMYIPFFSKLSNLEHNWECTDQRFIDAFPTKREAIMLFLKQMKLLVLVNNYRTKYLNSADLQFPFDMVCIELLKAANSDNYINFLWFRNYFSRVGQPRKVFYTDEFYTSGRLISAAARQINSPKICTYGIQHGLFNPYHNVYTISDREIESLQNSRNDGMPMPNHFIVWGDYFKNIFLKYNSIGKQFVIVAGNLKYILLDKTSSESNSGKLNILWCTTLIYHFNKEYEVLEPVLKEIQDYNLVFRLHPVGHISEPEILENLEPEILQHASISRNRNIFDDIRAADLVVSSSSSTTFLDAILLDKKSIRVMNGTSRTNFMDERVRNLFDVSNSAQFRNALFKDLKPENESNLGVLDVGDIFYLRSDVWESILN